MPSNGSIIPTTDILPPDPPHAGNLNSPSWPTPPVRFFYKVASVDLGAGKENHVCEVLAFLRVNVTNPDMSFARSPLFIITRP